ncbi:FecCD family ABC transporter permease [Terriglobus albidus]|uniref:FecCD family ABC transporter permease n=1 Tax=Terriglobus albidus TaxID=1592106 RepID=UPI0021DFCCDD|nr:iron ABC transporter permease [Terriglobus albidus]
MSNLGYFGIVCLLLFILLISLLTSASIGAVHIPTHDLLHAALRDRALTETQSTILLSIRLPRVLASAIVGAALAASGLMFQGLFRNPMADPYIIGASGGAAVGACVGIIFLSQLTFFGFSSTALLAFVGAVLTMTVVYSLARVRGRTNGVTLLLAGFAVGTMLSNSTYLLQLLDPNSSSGTRIVAAWLHGTISVPGWRQLAITFVLFFLALIACYPLMRRLNTLALGDEYAQQLGVRVEATRIAIIITGSWLTALAVSLGGLISFAGLIIPHVIRLLLGPDNVRLLPVTVISGAIFLVIADTLARSIVAPSELPVGILMVFLGGPFFLYLLRKRKKEYAL